MDNFNSVNEKIDSVKRKISLLEWDLPNMKESRFKAYKKRLLSEKKDELDELLKLKLSHKENEG